MASIRLQSGLKCHEEVLRMHVGGSAGKEPAWDAGDLGLTSGTGKTPRRREWLPTLVSLVYS